MGAITRGAGSRLFCCSVLSISWAASCGDPGGDHDGSGGTPPTGGSSAGGEIFSGGEANAGVAGHAGSSSGGGGIGAAAGAPQGGTSNVEGGASGATAEGGTTSVEGGMGGAAGDTTRDDRVRWLGPCTPVGLSDDARTVLTLEGVWTEQSGWIALLDLPGGELLNTPRVLSGDGRVVYGDSSSTLGQELYRFDVATRTIEGLGRVYDGDLGSEPKKVPEGIRSIDTNYDGGLLVGFQEGSPKSLFRWTPSEGFSAIPTPQDEAGFDFPPDSALLSSNSLTLAFTGWGSGSNPNTIILSSLSVSMLGSGLFQRSFPTAVSGDGRFVAQYLTAFGTEPPPDCIGLAGSCAYANQAILDFDHAGRFAIGKEYYGAAGTRFPVGTFYWSQSGGVDYLSEALFRRGAYADVETLSRAAISADGQRVLGRGTRHYSNGATTTECFLATLSDPVDPEPLGAAPITSPPLGILAANLSRTCITEANGTVRCWGADPARQAGEARLDWSAQSVPSLSTASRVAVGDAHTCALLSDHSVRCWGNNGVGQLGNGSTLASTIPVAVSGLTNVRQIAAGGSHTCALLDEGSVWCWGSNAFSELGAGSGGNSSAPLTVATLPRAKALAASQRSTCALLESGDVWCWGQTLPAEDQETSAPAAVRGLDHVTQLALGNDYGCALLEDATVRCWGALLWVYTDPTIGLPSPRFDAAGAYPLLFAGPVVQVAVGATHTCAILGDGTVECAGWNARGQLGTQDHRARLDPAPVANVSGAIAIACGAEHTCALLETGAIQCWGADDAGQLGIGVIFTNRPAGLSSPVSVPGVPGPN